MLHYVCMRRPRLVLRGLLLSVAVFGVLGFGSVSAQYGSDVYGGCDYGQNCATETPPTVVDVPPSPGNQAPGRVFAVNITDNQIFVDPQYSVEITPNFPTDDISEVRLLVDGVIVGRATEADELGTYHIVWNVSEYSGQVVRVEMELADGNIINQDFNVRVQLGQAPTSGGEQPTGQGGASSDHTQGGGVALTGLRKFMPESMATSVERLIRATPVPVAYAMPYVFLAVLGGFAAALLWQARNQMHHAKILLALLARDKELADEKTNFVMLASHYMRTPITVINGSLELVPKDDNTQPLVERIQTSTRALQQQFEVILKDTTDSKDLAQIATPDIPEEQKRLTLSWRVIAPISVSAILIVITNFLFVVGQRIRFNIPNVVLQFVLWLVVTYVVLVFWQRRQDARRERLAVDAQRSKEEVLDKARNTFIQRAADELRPNVVLASQASVGLPNDSNTQRIQSSIQQLKSTMDRFVLVALLERGRIQNEASDFELGQVVATEVGSFEKIVQSKTFSVDVQVDPIRLTQNQMLLRYVLHSLLDNATKHTPAGNKITIRATQPSKNRAQVRIRNYGVGMTEEQLGKLFRPFSRTASGESFQDEGIGLGLYLSRLIMRYLGGELSLESTSAKSTLAQMQFPMKLKL